MSNEINQAPTTKVSQSDADAKFVETAYSDYAAIVAENGKIPYDSAVFRTTDGKTQWFHIIDMPRDPEGKNEVIAQLRQFARKQSPDLLVLLLESWSAPSSAEVRPTDHPERKEVILVSVEQAGHAYWDALVNIERDSTGRPSIPACLPPLEYAGDMRGRSRWAGIITPIEGEAQAASTEQTADVRLLDHKRTVARR